MLLMPFLGGAVSFFVSTPSIGGAGAISCKPRNSVAPGRLNIAAEPDGYGVIPPCKANVSIYIARNTSLRSIDGVLRLSTPDGRLLSKETRQIGLARTDYGMFAAEVGLEPVSDTACPDVSIGLEIKSCRGGAGELIACPEIRVKSPPMFAELAVSGESLSICHDD